MVPKVKGHARTGGLVACLLAMLVLAYGCEYDASTGRYVSPAEKARERKERAERIEASRKHREARKIEIINGPAPRESVLSERVRMERDSIDRTSVYKHVWWEDALGPVTSIEIEPRVIAQDDVPVPMLGIRVAYSGSNWLFADQITFAYGDNQFDLRGRFDRQIGYNKIVETYTRVLHAHEIKVLREVASEQRVTLRIRGTRSYADYQLSRADLNVLRDMFEVFDILIERQSQ